MALLDDVKVCLRLSTTAFDDAEIIPLIDACKLDLSLAGVVLTDEADPLIERAVVLYCKGNFGFDEKSDRYLKAYDSLKNALALSGDYNGFGGG